MRKRSEFRISKSSLPTPVPDASQTSTLELVIFTLSRRAQTTGNEITVNRDPRGTPNPAHHQQVRPGLLLLSKAPDARFQLKESADASPVSEGIVLPTGIVIPCESKWQDQSPSS